MVHIMQKNFKWDRWSQRENLEQITRNEYVVDDSWCKLKIFDDGHEWLKHVGRTAEEMLYLTALIYYSGTIKKFGIWVRVNTNTQDSLSI